MTFPSSSLVFKVERSEPELLRPAKPTPHDLKGLSDIDDQEGLRFQIPFIQFYKENELMKGKDPVKVIREAIAKTLVYYYPFAGRLREESGRKLMVDCTGEGILFIEANADVTLEQFGDALQPPFPFLEELLYDVPGSSGIVGCPLLLIQVTRLTCGGFIFALRLNHTISNAAGLVQFMNAVADMARGLSVPSVYPVWDRTLLNAHDPPRVTFVHREFNEVPCTKGTLMPLDDLADRSFFFGPKEVTALKKNVPPHLQKSSKIEVVTACLWRCRTIALNLTSDDEVRLLCLVNTRAMFNPKLPEGYYGNTFVSPVAVSTAGDLCKNSLGYALELLKKAKATVTEDYVKSVASLLVLKGRPHPAVVGSYVVSDVTRAGFSDINFGWGKAAYGGPAKSGVGAIPGFSSFCIPRKNSKGEDGILVPICLPGSAMERFVLEMERMLKEPMTNHTSSCKIVSAL